ncbi:MAG: hypothetical protein RAO94_05625 [Candidatus Stygibacter australis]|nr:hypothetical protein [Candidatus Stygibacter australis]MDP8321809.1 hypothetical protein [Candidatus Stygibacter australis]
MKWEKIEAGPPESIPDSSIAGETWRLVVTGDIKCWIVDSGFCWFIYIQHEHFPKHISTNVAKTRDDAKRKSISSIREICFAYKDVEYFPQELVKVEEGYPDYFASLISSELIEEIFYLEVTHTIDCWIGKHSSQISCINIEYNKLPKHHIIHTIKSITQAKTEVIRIAKTIFEDYNEAAILLQDFEE